MEAFLQRFCGNSPLESFGVTIQRPRRFRLWDEESCKLVGFWPLAHLPATVESRQFVILIAAEKATQ
jgi:hypothetical protein